MGGLRTAFSKSAAAARVGLLAACVSSISLAASATGAQDFGQDISPNSGTNITPDISRNIPLSHAALSTSSVPPLARTFAFCTGRLSATMEHQWLILDPRSAQTEKHREAMIELLEAVASDADRRALLELRIAAKHAHTKLLTLASFEADKTIANRARARADAYYESCLSMMLG